MSSGRIDDKEAVKLGIGPATQKVHNAIDTGLTAAGKAGTAIKSSAVGALDSIKQKVLLDPEKVQQGISNAGSKVAEWMSKPKPKAEEPKP